MKKGAEKNVVDGGVEVNTTTGPAKQYPEKVAPVPKASLSGEKITPVVEKFGPAQGIYPKHNRIVVKRTPETTMTKGGLHIPETAREKPLISEVVAVGPGLTDRPMTIRVGELVLHSKYAGTDVTYNDAEYVIMMDTDVLAGVD